MHYSSRREETKCAYGGAGDSLKQPARPASTHRHGSRTRSPHITSRMEPTGPDFFSAVLTSRRSAFGELVFEYADGSPRGADGMH